MDKDVEGLKARIISALDVVEFLDILGYELADILDKFEEELEENYPQLDRACR
jgi:hypothetical protein